jgi:hypothetical protein
MKKTFILAFGFFVALLLTGCSMGGDLSEEEAKQVAEDFINSTLMPPGGTATVKEVSEENDMYKIVVSANGQEITSYLSEDGKMFFPNAMNIEEASKAKEEQAVTESAAKAAELADMEKKEVPVVELFIMSHCPFGTQMEKGIIPVVETLGDKIDFQLKFVNYAMHAKKELDEQMVQYCVKQEEPTKLIQYLRCFLEDETGTQSCLASTGVNVAKNNACIAATDKEFGVTTGFEDKTTWVNSRFPKFMTDNDDNLKYGVQGSPTLVINGKKVGASRDAKSLMDLICGGFETAPEECSTPMSSDQPAPGFGWSGAAPATGGGAECGS